MNKKELEEICNVIGKNTSVKLVSLHTNIFEEAIGMIDDHSGKDLKDSYPDQYWVKLKPCHQTIDEKPFMPSGVFSITSENIVSIEAYKGV